MPAAAAETGIHESPFEMNQEDVPMDTTSFLPLVLQAQDLISKLENRVVELESDLETINEAHEQEREQLLQEIGEKDEYIHNLKTKVSRLEFGAREAIVVLARTVEMLKAQNIEDDDDISSKEDDDATAVESTDLEGQFLDSIKLCLNYLKNSQNNLRAPRNHNGNHHENPQNSQRQIIDSETKPLSPPPVRRDSSNKPVKTIEEEVENLVASTENDPNNTTDVQRRESISSSHVSLDDINGLDEYELDGSEDIAEFILDEEETNKFTAQYELTKTKDEKPESQVINQCHSPQDNGSDLSIEIDNRENDPLEHDHLRIESDDYLERELDSGDDEETVDEEDEKEDDPNALPRLGPIENVSHQTQSICPNCESLLEQVDQHIEERAYIKRDLSAMAISLSEEQALRVQTQNAKEDLELEIDDWVNAMFEKVNQMVFDEANSREELEILNREAKGKLGNALKASASREDRLRDMKLLLVHLDSIKQRQGAPTPTPPPGILSRTSSIRRSIMSNSPMNSPRVSKNFGHMSPSLFSASMEDFMFAKGRKVYIDGIIYEEFQEYVKSFTTNPPPNSLNLNSSYMKRCMIEDIQPCLFEGNSGWKSPFYKRRLLDAIIKNQCEIQTIYFNTSMPSTPTTSQISISSRSSYQEPPPAPKVKCGLCGCLRSCDFRMRISGPDVAVPPSATSLNSANLSVTERPGWILLDRFCRDRIVAVCDFYGYLSHLRQGLLANSPVWGIYKQCLRHRRKMGMARVGSVSMFENDESNDFESSDLEGMVVIVH
ncbi:hypothetical protein G9A89_018952 [Geosiphon pyriformis]|nr:hypothetical protein G9A89_018952 [Geosiphon pyriformis]